MLTIALLIMVMGCRSAEPVVDKPEPEYVEEEVQAKAKPDTYVEVDLPDVKREFRAVWVATVANIDWPSKPGLSVDEQQNELIEILDKAASLHLNTVIFQVRPAADALYESPYEPWASYLTGTMGQGPLPHYDPLEFVVREAHKRGLELHAWFNPYRAGHPSDRSELSSDHISKTNPEWVHQFGDFLWLDPGHPEAKEHTLNVILDVVERYDIDGVHFDDYFYPYPSYDEGREFPDSLSWQKAQNRGVTLSKEDWRRNNVDTLIKELSERIKEIDPEVKFGISPFGIWRPGYPENTTGFDAYSELYADAKLWLNEGWLDYFTPQIYYKSSQMGQPFPIMLEWWVEQNDHDIHMWPGLFTSRVRTQNPQWPLNEIIGQVYTARSFPGVTGAVHFSMRTFSLNSEDINRQIAAGPYAIPALKPTSPWMSSDAPAQPEVEYSIYYDRWTLSFHSKDNSDVRWWAVRLKTDDNWETDIIPGYRRHVVYHDGKNSVRPDTVMVTGINRLGNESELSEPVYLQNDGIRSSFEPENLITRTELIDEEPGGIKANSVRRNISLGDTLQFRDLTLIYKNQHVSKIKNEGEDEANDSEKATYSTQIDSIDVQLFRNGVKEYLTMKPRESLNWYGYHIGLLGIPGSLAQFEVATVQSLPVDRAMNLETGGASERFKVPHTIEKITIHHTGSSEPLTEDDNPKDLLRGLYIWGAEEQNWWDLPYHYLIDLDGQVYEGRDPKFAGETNTGYDTRGHLLISVIGNYNLQEPTTEQQNAIAKLTAQAIEYYNLDFDEITTHSDWADTNCPGKYLLEFVNSGDLQQAVLEWLNEN